MEKLLLVEDDLALGQGFAWPCKLRTRPVTLCRTLAQARQALEGGALCPGHPGREPPRRQRPDVPGGGPGPAPVILLTANDWETDIVAGLELGAEDYITKPFSLAVLRARVNAQLRRSRGESSTVAQVGPFTFDFGRMEYRKHGRLVDLSKTEQKLLRLLVQNRGTTLTRADLVDRIWTDGAEYVDENALSVTVKRLRDKLEDTPPSPSTLRRCTVWGYTWAVV